MREPSASEPRPVKARAARRRWLVAILAVVSLAAGIAGCAGGDSEGGADASSSTTEVPKRAVRATPVVRLPGMVTGLAARGDDPTILVTERRGVVWRVTLGEDPAPEPEQVLDRSASISTLGERGLYDVRFIPGQDAVVISYTDLEGTITVERFPYDPDEPLDPDAGQVLVALPRSYAWHNGGGLAVLDDGSLLLGVGDMEFRGLGVPGAQDPDLILGGVLRIPAPVVRGEDPGWEPTPADLIARGLRNPWRLSVDEPTGDVWIGDVGLNSYEEVNTIPAAEVDGVTNFGWPYVEGPEPGSTPTPDGIVLRAPVLARPHSDSVCGMVGGLVYRGSAMAELRGHYLYADLCGEDLRAFSPTSDGPADDRSVGLLSELLVAIAEGPGREAYGLGSGGLVVRFDPAETAEQETEPTDRATQDCEGIIAAIVPLEGFGDLDPETLERRLREANLRIAAAIPELPEDWRADGLAVQEAFLELQRRLEEIDWDTASPAIGRTRDEMLAGTGTFEGLPEALARMVDRTCG